MTALRGNPIDALVRSCLLEERSGDDSFAYQPPIGNPYTLKWTLHNVCLLPVSCYVPVGQLGYRLMPYYRAPAADLCCISSWLLYRTVLVSIS